MEAFQLRLWDGRIGRWLSPDPYGQYDSPYLGMGNNPVNSIDPDGGMDEDPGKGFPSILNNYQPQYGPENSTIAYQINLSGLTVINNYHKPSSNFNIDGGFSGRAFPIIGFNSVDNHISNKGLAFLTAREGVRLKPYNDSKGFATIGIGHLIGKRGKTSQDIKDWAWLDKTEEAQDLLGTDLSRTYEPAVRNLVKVKLTAPQYDAIVSFTYNVGIHGLKKSNFLKALNKGIYNGNLMLNYHKPVEIIGRRTREVNLFNNGKY